MSVGPRGWIVLTDLGYLKRQVLFARGCNGRLQTGAVHDALTRALDALERIGEALTAQQEQEACAETLADVVIDHLAVTQRKA